MAETPKGDGHVAGGAAKRPEVGTKSDQSGSTGAGTEPIRGGVPEGHTREHQSNYGGGGANGGASDDAKTGA
jgi:hypothetical protein